MISQCDEIVLKLFALLSDTSCNRPWVRHIRQAEQSDAFLNHQVREHGEKWARLRPVPGRHGSTRILIGGVPEKAK